MTRLVMDSRPLLQHPLLFPSVLAALALLLLIAGSGAFAFAFLMFALGLFLWMMGKARRWKGAPEAGYIVAGIGALVALMALLG